MQQVRVISLVSIIAAATIFFPLCVIDAETGTQGLSGKSRRSLPFGLRIEEHLLQGKPAGDVTKPFFEPVQGSDKKILKHHAGEREHPVSPDNKVFIDNETLEAKEYYIESDATHQVGVRLIRKEKTIFSEIFGDVSPVNPIWGLWDYQKHWFLEVARCKNKKSKEGNALSIGTDCQGDIIHDGKSVDKRNGYKESFSFQLMNGKLFYFFEKDRRIGISYGGEEVVLGYEEIPHYYCCEPSMLNPKAFQNMVSFFARRDNNNWYYVEIGAFR